MSQKPTRLGLTGGIGSGKSTVSEILASLGAVIIDADSISRRLTAQPGAALEAIKQQFGQEMINADGTLNRTSLRHLVFANIDAKKHLEAIIHPMIKLEMQIEEQTAINSGVQFIVYDIPLLVESQNWRPILNNILVIDCLKETQVKRVMLRNTFRADDVEKIINTQASRKMRNSAADFVIFNDSITVEQLREQVLQVAICLNTHPNKHNEHMHPFDERK